MVNMVKKIVQDSRRDGEVQFLKVVGMSNVRNETLWIEIFNTGNMSEHRKV